MQREIHVNSYVKRDGTHVREHVRNVNTIGLFAPKQESQKIIFEENPNKTNPVLYYSDELGGEFSEYGSPRVLTGGIGYYDFQDGTVDVGTVDRGSSGGGSVGNIVSEVVKVISEVMPMFTQLVSALNSGNSSAVAYWQPQVNSKIKQINLKQNQVENIIKEYSKKLAKTKNKTEYSKLYETLSKINIPHRKLSSMVYAVNAYANNGNYAQAAAELENFKNNSTPMINDSLLASNNIQKGGINTSSTNTSIPTSPVVKTVPKTNVEHNETHTNNQTNKVNSNALFHGHPHAQKGIVDKGFNILSLSGKINDANALWKISADELNNESEYINQSGMLINSVNQLPPKFREIVQQKLRQQINKDNARGIIFNSTSSLAKCIGHSKEFRQYILDNFDKLKDGRVLESGSTYFGSDLNLRLALGHADILFAQIHKEGYLSAIIMDTYDFNKSDPDWKVKIAYDVQEAGLIENYYLLIVVLIPLHEIKGI